METNAHEGIGLLVLFVIVGSTMASAMSWDSFKYFWKKECKMFPEKMLLVAWAGLYVVTAAMLTTVALSVISLTTLSLIKIIMG